MRRYWRQSATFFCHSMECAGLTGVEVRQHPATETDPPEWETDSCPHCGHDLHEQALPWWDAADALLDTLADAGALGFPKDQVERRELMSVVMAELQRQSGEHWRAEHEARRRVIDEAFPPAELLPI